MIQYRDDPAVLLFASGAEATGTARRAAEEAGCRVADLNSIESGAERLDRQAWTDSVYVEAAGEEEGLEALLDRIEAAARLGLYRSVVSVPFELVDMAFARAPHPDVELLSSPTDGERVAAIGRATAPRQARLHDIGKGEPSVLIDQMREQMGKMASLLAELSEDERAPVRADGGGPQKLDAGHVRAIIRARRLRDQYLPADLFADPAWDMLLDLMAARLEGRRVAVSSLCIAAAVPATTALRWIKMLTDRGLVVRSADPQDGRRVYIELADEAAHTLTEYLSAAQRISSVGI